MRPWTRLRPGTARYLSPSFLSLTLLPLLGLGSVAAQGLPPDEEGALAHLDASPRHGEWVDFDAGGGDMVRAWVVYPERAEAAPVVVVIHEIYALTDWIRGVADQFAAVVVLKGCGPVVADPGGRYAICPLGNPGMATAGTGDVVSGVIGAVLAQGLDCWAAATVGVVAHAWAGDLAAAHAGERGMLASDITGRLPQVLNP